MRARRAGPAIAPLVLLAALLGLPRLADPLAAQERIRAYDSEVEVRADGTLEVTERITVVAEGRQIRRGIYRDFPTRYRDRYGNRVRVDLEVLGVERNGRPEAWFTERIGNGVRINTGGDEFLPVPAEYTFTLRFRTTRQLGFFEDHDELYWNAIGTGWVFPIERGRVEVRLPEPVPVERMGVEGYTGPQGVSGAAYNAEVVGPGVARFTLTEPLGPQEGFTIVLTFPKELVEEPARATRVRWFLADNRGALIGLVGLAILLVFCVIRWWQVGRDPPRGVVIPRYNPREGQTPAAARYLSRMSYDSRCFSSDVLDLAVAGHLRIHRDEKSSALRLPKFLTSAQAPDWRLERDGASPKRPPDATQRTLLTGLFPFGTSRLELKPSNATTISGAQTAHQKALDAALHGRYFNRNTRSVVVAMLIAVATSALAFLASGGNGIPAIVAVFALMAVTVLVFGTVIRAPTPEGRGLMDEVEGLKEYLSVAERQELAGLEGPGAPPPLDAARYEALLPFAVALDVEDAWTARFTAAVGAAAAAAATAGMTWYAGTGRITDMGSFSRSLGSGLTSQIASASSPPGSSSGSGGGGSSGGGGGGGGGGGR